VRNYSTPVRVIQGMVFGPMVQHSATTSFTMHRTEPLYYIARSNLYYTGTIR
jgi:hypothetical protein